ncbi:hypothetical protein GCM10025868_02020 [Angustibacter aerolatus]|uniref:HTH araC/xylS-type domain-containing protein n=1 Tax=Angustibacter aerolatus TaxID=1162965 RepID=A0ABQ6JAZ3_9ACTN|nr:hypothetical protein [Angustibacter aerolatus]GMA84952.1 hypothetical protein GCM10025868_02020 [Angustibacter aerolatus]
MQARGSEVERLLPGSVMLLPTRRDYTAVLDHLHEQVLRLPRSTAEALAAERCGEGHRLRLDGLRPVSPGAERAWLGVQDLVHGMLLDPDETLGAHEPARPPDRALRRRRAARRVPEQHHARRPDVGGAGGQRHRASRDGVHRGARGRAADPPAGSQPWPASARAPCRRRSPGTWGRRPPPTCGGCGWPGRTTSAGRPARDGVTVAEVAARWGFGNPGRLAGDHRAAYGELPTATLRGATRT